MRGGYEVRRSEKPYGPKERPPRTFELKVLVTLKPEDVGEGLAKNVQEALEKELTVERIEVALKR
jgi:hypothetical protein